MSYPAIVGGLCGLLMALGAPGYGLWILPWLALTPLLVWSTPQAKASSSFEAGFWFGCAYFGLYSLWFFDLHPLTWLGFSTLGSRLVTLAGWLLMTIEGGVLCGLLMLAYCWLKTSLKQTLLFPILWVLGFSLLNLTPFALPWPLVEYTQAPLWGIRWLAGWISGSGVALCVVGHNVFWAQMWQKVLETKESTHTRGNPPAVLNRFLAFILMLITPFLLFSVEQRPQKDTSTKAILKAEASKHETNKHHWPIPVAVIQGNLPIDVIRAPQSAQHRDALIERAYFAPLQNAHFPPGSLINYPEEGVVPGWVVLSEPERNPFFRRLETLARSHRLYITVGVSLFDDKHQKSYNALALISPNEHNAQFYKKRRLVPFGEYTPYGLGDTLTSVLQYFGIDYAATFEAGKDAPLLWADNIPIGGLVCFDLIDTAPLLGGYAQQYSRNGAKILINASNLGWFHQNRWLEAQFLSMAQMRAAETRLPLVIASNTGISAILSPLGDILSQVDFQIDSQHKTQVIFYNAT